MNHPELIGIFKEKKVKIKKALLMDWYEDHDEPLLVEAVRWTMKWRVNPMKWDNYYWDWYDLSRMVRRGRRGHANSDIPFAVFLNLQGATFANYDLKRYNTKWEAEEAVLHAYKHARELGWKGEKYE